VRDVLFVLALAIVTPFFVGMLTAFLFPPLCWWLEKRAAKAKANDALLAALARARTGRAN
jgi:predicted PurR-regulated permease PerM